MSTDYATFLADKAQGNTGDGFAPADLPTSLFDFQVDLVEWAVRRGRAAIFADCGLGKTPMQLAWADQIVRHENKHVLVLLPLAVGAQTLAEADKFGIEAMRSSDGRLPNTASIVLTNYERLHYFSPDDFAGVVCDESSILKNFDGERRAAITAFMRKHRYRLLCTATAAPNDYHELGTSSEALGELGYTDVLSRFFKNDQNNVATGRLYGHAAKWRFKGHAERPFWRWVSSWARAIRRPSDLGYSNERHALPALVEREHEVVSNSCAEGMLFALPAHGLKEQREELRRTVGERSEYVASLVNGTGQPALVWCHLNDEAAALARLIPDAVEVSGADSDDAKEEKLLSFARGQSRVLVTKPKIGAWGLNFQHCAHVTMYPSHSFEQYYQSVRRCWRFGQTRPVQVDVVTTEGQRGVLANLQRKATQADRMFDALVEHMNSALIIQRAQYERAAVEVPAWL